MVQIGQGSGLFPDAHHLRVHSPLFDQRRSPAAGKKARARTLLAFHHRRGSRLERLALENRLSSAHPVSGESPFRRSERKDGCGHYGWRRQSFFIPAFIRGQKRENYQAGSERERDYSCAKRREGIGPIPGKRSCGNLSAPPRPRGKAKEGG